MRPPSEGLFLCRLPQYRGPSNCHRTEDSGHAANDAAPIRLRPSQPPPAHPGALRSSETDSFLDLLIQQLLAECQELIARGLHRRYEPMAARLASPRGRLDLQALARDGIVTAELPCRFHPRVEDCLQNRSASRRIAIHRRNRTRPGTCVPNSGELLEFSRMTSRAFA